MSQESEQPRFRRGENAKRPYGGQIADTPFAKALSELASDRGFETQRSLSKTLGKSSNMVVYSWYHDKNIPTPVEFGNLIIKLQPNDEKMEALIDTYAFALRKGREKSARELSPYELSRKIQRPELTPVSQWVEDFCNNKNITMGELFVAIGRTKWTSSRRGRLGLVTLSLMLEKVPEVYHLSEVETESLCEAVVLEIQNRLQEGRRLANTSSGPISKEVKESLRYRAYTGRDAAAELGVSSVTVSKLGKKLNLPILFTEEHLDILRVELERTKVGREKLQRTWKEKRSKEISLSE